MKRKQPAPYCIAIVGGSGAGKSWLGDRLKKLLGSQVARLSQDDFYHDRSHLSLPQRSRVNFDHPRAIDWPALEKVVREFAAGRAVTVPRYDFRTHSRRPRFRQLRPKPWLIVDGLWLLRRPALRKYFDLRLFISCSAEVRFKRRMARDMLSRGRDAVSIRRQFWGVTQPMHARYVDAQARWAHLRWRSPITGAQAAQLARQLRREREKLYENAD